jgi:hypothetical protein
MSERDRLVEQASGEGARFRQGEGGPPLRLDGLREGVRTDQPVSLVEPAAAALEWSETLARRWACDCVERALPLVEDPDGDGAPLHHALAVARQYTTGETPRDVLDGVFIELHVEEWPSYEGAFFEAVRAVRFLTARDAGAESPWGRDVIVPGRWAADAALAAARAVAEHARTEEPDAARRDGAAAKALAAEHAWQGRRLLDYLTGQAR